MVGNGPLPLAGRVTSTSSGTRSKLGTPLTVRPGGPSVVGQNRVPSARVLQGWPNGAGVWAAIPGAGATAPARTAITRQRRIPRSIPDARPHFSTTRCSPSGGKHARAEPGPSAVGTGSGSAVSPVPYAVLAARLGSHVFPHVVAAWKGVRGRPRCDHVASRRGAPLGADPGRPWARGRAGHGAADRRAARRRPARDGRALCGGRDPR